MHGFIPGSGASFAADCTLVTEMAIGLGLAAGTGLTRQRRYRAHAWCQSAVVLLNLLLIVPFMVSAFRRAVVPGLPTDLGKSRYWLATTHGALGVIAELFGLYVVLAAGTNLLPNRMRFGRYRLWMRVALALWFLVLILGLATYVQWYVVPLRTTDSGPVTAQTAAKQPA